MKAATIISTLCWIVSIALSCTLKADNIWIWLPDLFLLIGFFPLLIVWRRHWLTFLFGLFNAGIGFFLIILKYLPDEKFTGTLAGMRNHLLTMHSGYCWLVVGVFALLWGIIGIAAIFIKWILARMRRKSAV